MTREELSHVLDGARRLVRDLSAGFEQRLSAIEAKARGIDGKDGPMGLQGQKGEPGRDGLQGLMGIPGDDGKNGTDGQPGLGFEELDAVYDDVGRMSLRFIRGAVVKSFRVPGIIDRGVFKDGTAYEKGDGVSWAGSFWIAQEATIAKPGTPDVASRAWRLSVKAGRDGKK